MDPPVLSPPELRTLPSALDPAVHSLHKAQALVGMLGEIGIDAESALHGSGIHANDLTNVGARMSIRQLMRIFRNASSLVDDPMFALNAGRRCHLSVLGYFGLALLASETWRHSMDCFQRYRQLSTPVLGVSFSAEDDLYVMTYFDALDIDPDLFSFVLDFHMGMGLTLQRDMFGPEFSYDSVRLSYPRPDHAADIERLFEAPVEFHAAHNQLLWSTSWIDRPVVQANALTSQAMCEICDQLSTQIVAESGKAGVVTRILDETRYEFPGIDDVARRMNVTSRTLRRWLLAEGTSYADILDAVRARMAIRYLRSTHMKADEISTMLGFSTTASFRSAFKRWTGRQPSQYRPHSRARAESPQVGGADATRARSPDLPVRPPPHLQ